MRGKVRHLQTVADLSASEIMEILQFGQKLKVIYLNNIYLQRWTHINIRIF